MGSHKVSLVKDVATRQQCMDYLLKDLRALERMIERGMFDRGVRRMGAEQEFAFVDERWRPAPVLMEVLEQVKDEHFTTELAVFNMEVNLDPQKIGGSCFSDLERQLGSYLAKADKISSALKAHPILVGILPSIRRSDIGLKNLTPLERYRALMDVLREIRGSHFEFWIEGTDQLITKAESSMFESCNTSFQVHFQVWPEEFAEAYNWSQLVTGPLLAASTNSPMLLGKRLWRETRIALFQQAVDTRNTAELSRERSQRVSFGRGWVRESVMELYREEVAMHKLLLKPQKMEDALRVLEGGEVPRLYSLSIHSGTIYRWNRACYGINPNGKPHLRIENRVLPAGPSTADETANAAFWLGMMLNMPPKYRRLWEKMDFDLAKGNFLRAARQGLGVYFSWPGLRKKISAPELIRKELLPIACEGLKKAKVAAKDTERYLGIIEERVRSGKTGSQWILDSFNSLRRQSSKDEAIVATTAALWKRQQSGKPVHEWEPAQLTEAGNWMNRFGTIQQIMSTDLVTASENDLIDFVAQLMNWRNIRHLPIENDRGELVGLITSKQLVQHYSENCDRPDIRSAKDIMITKIVAVEPDTPTIEAVELMREHGFSCLPVLQEKKLFGIVTESDFVNMAAQVLKEWKE